jgi:hypothetical protein
VLIPNSYYCLLLGAASCCRFVNHVFGEGLQQDLAYIIATKSRGLARHIFMRNIT